MLPPVQTSVVRSMNIEPNVEPNVAKGFERELACVVQPRKAGIKTFIVDSHENMSQPVMRDPGREIGSKYLTVSRVLA